MSTTASICSLISPGLSDNTNHHSKSSRNRKSAASPPKKLRRHNSLQAIRARLNSLELSPDPDSSSYDGQSYEHGLENAEPLSVGSETFVTGGKDTWDKLTGDDHSLTARQSVLAHNSPVQSVHYPTPLETIIEKKSIATLSLQGSLSIRPKNTLSPDVLDRPGSSENARHIAEGCSKPYFSLDNLTIFCRPSRHYRTLSKEPALSFNPAERHHHVTPKELSPTRVPTPPEPPSLSTKKPALYQFPPPDLRFRSQFPTHKPTPAREWEAQTTQVSRGVTIRDETDVQNDDIQNVVSAGKEPSSQPPHHIQKAMICNSRQATFTTNGADQQERRSTLEPSAGRCLGEKLVQSVRTASTSISIRDRPTSTRPLEKSHKDQWTRFGEFFCIVCCGAEPSDDGVLHPRIVGDSMVRKSHTGPLWP